MITPESCRPGARCHFWKDCDRCASIRQAKIADATEELYQAIGQMHWTVITPRLQISGAIAAARAEWQRDNKAPAGLWTVERGKKTGGHHINILHGLEQTRTRSTVTAWNERVHGDVRHVAAYISKRAAAPLPAVYAGRAFGRFGPMWQHLTSRHQEPLVAGVAWQGIINPGPMKEAARTAQWRGNDAPPKTWAEQREIARRYLPDLIHAMRSKSSK